MEKVGDLGFGELELRRPEQCLERADLYADPAVHTEREVDVEAIQGVLLAGLAAGATRRGLVLVALDVDAPVRALAGAQHAGSAVVLVKRDDTAGPGRGGLLDLRVLHGVRPLDQSTQHGSHGHAQALNEARQLQGRGHQKTTFRTPVSTMLSNDNGISTFQASCWSWSSRKRG